MHLDPIFAATSSTSHRAPRSAGVLALLFAAALLGACVSPASEPLAAARAARSAGDLDRAVRLYEQALATAPDHRVVQAELSQARGALVDQTLDEVGTRLGEAPSPEALRGALAVLEKLGRHAQGHAAYRAARAGYEGDLAKAMKEQEGRAAQARTALRSGDLAAAQRQLAAIRSADPSWPGLSALEGELGRWRIDHGTRRATKALEAGDIPGARAALRALEGVDDPRVAEVRGRFLAAELEWLDRRTKTLTGADQYYTAFLELQESGREGDLGELVRRVRYDGADHYLAQARLRLTRGESGRAYLEAMKGLELSPDDPRLFDVHRDARDQQLQSVQTYIAVPTFATPSSRPDLGAQFSDALISHLFRVLPYGVNIVEREKIDLLLRERNNGFAELGNMLNVDLIVSGNVSLMEIDRQESTQKALARVKVGERQEPNPAYDAAYKRAPRRADGSVDESRLPAATLEVPIHESVRYEKGSVTVKGFSTVAARIFSTNQAAIVYAQEFNARYQATDHFQDAVDDAGVEGDALVLPSETEVVESLRSELVQKVSGLIEDQFKARHASYLKDARYRLARRERAAAMDPLASGFLYALKAEVPAEDETYGELLDLIVTETERDFLAPDVADVQVQP